MTKSAKWGVIIVIGLLIVGMIVYPRIKSKLTTSKNASEVVPPSSPALRTQVLNINAQVLKQQTLSETYRTTGSTMPDEEVDLSFESSGKIVAIYFKEGTHVKEGDLLAKINDKPLQAQLKKLEAEVPLATDRVYRQRTLLEKDAVSQEAFEQVTTDYEKLMADIELVKANIAQTELRAPFDGIIGLRFVSEGAYATPSTVIVKLTKISPLKIEFSVPERYESDVKDGTPITFHMQATDGMIQKYHAKVYAVEATIDQTTRTLKVRATYPNQNEAILPGRYLSVEVTKREIKDALAVPSEAVIPEMGKSIVYLYKGGVAMPAEIVTGLRTESHVQALEGLHPGDTLITTGVMQLRTGMKVMIDNLN
ncbi:membrane fusion protein (multidrug efflux system) [Parabacteroides sp. PF5-5]|uniref:efflux RND transporter periplasmic adaptor subunit n=1 Tax=unclassified Parabacteroides TaxID=2649774 RepID=UPI0024731383|nr:MULTISPECIES: efflux RND transporter periplasmic adaptor subunit [unclassified Parabacteroides]MDH6306311.1 membrane fusion protein (multidrug efflux system) [Parabacteroides sp. PH5-39]MDH6316898.1 membrane fusion protein (multidrug efflux system) [Parabacteroides sp. PF5-13]MDH6320967.1 membrane fusion protein (multidrug efflux system) [Parabacteroides sp. PH5-13]MDH6324699.1 membrane fusion protein (multidrug efflux system) [Parabacteroides sp. PH5-8]MDH6328083.1 membrane fusion protein 